MATRASFQRLTSNLINKTFADFRDVAVFELTGTADYDTQTTPILNTTTTKGIRLEYSKTQFQGSSIQEGDYKIVLEQQSIDFDVRADNVKMTFNGKAVSIISVSEDAARAALTLQVKDK